MILRLAYPVIVATTLQGTLVAVPQPSPAPVAQARAALAALEANEFAKVEERFTDDMKAAFPPGRLAQLWDTLKTQVGSLKSCGTEPKVVAISDKQMVITPCAFERATINVQFAFDVAGKLSGMAFRPAASASAAAAAYALPAYANSASFSETEVTVGSGEWALPGTLTVPIGDGPFPVVVLVHGSGPHDRDATVASNKPFKDLASGLSSLGVAVLRYDKRTFVHRGKLAATNFTAREEVTDDALAAVTFLRTQPKIDATRIFVLGHSLGGLLIPRIGSADSSIAGLIVLAGATGSIEDAIVRQTRHIAEGDGSITAGEKKAIDEITAIAEAIRALKPGDASSGRIIFGAPASYYLDLRGYDPPAAAAQLKQPMLILQGERDYQVTMTDFERWKSGLASRANVTFKSYPGLNHFFMAGTRPSLPAEYEVSGHVAEDVVRDIAAWVKR